MWAAVKTRPRLAAYGLALLFAAPFALGVVSQWRHGFAPLDFRAVACAGDAWLHAASLYARPIDCPFGAGMPFVYPPLSAQMLGGLQFGLGAPAEIGLLALIFGAALAPVLFELFVCDTKTLWFRAPFFCALTGRALLTGNLSSLFHAALFIAVVHGKNDILAATLVVFCAAAKPTFAPYLAVFLFMPRPWPRRLALIGSCAAAIAVYYALFRIAQPTEFAEWLSVARSVGVQFSGHGLLPWLAAFSIDGDAARLALYGLYSGLLLTAGVLASRRLGDPRERLYLGLAVCILLNPRLMYYDHFTLPFGMAAVASACASGRFERPVHALLCLVGVAVIALAGTRGGETLLVGCLALLATLALRTPPPESQGHEALGAAKARRVRTAS